MPGFGDGYRGRLQRQGKGQDWKGKMPPRKPAGLPSSDKSGIHDSLMNYAAKLQVRPITTQGSLGARLRGAEGARATRLSRNKFRQPERRRCRQPADRHGLQCTARRPCSRVTTFQISEDSERGQGHHRRIRQPMHRTRKKDVRRKRNQSTRNIRRGDRGRAGHSARRGSGSSSPSSKRIMKSTQASGRRLSASTTGVLSLPSCHRTETRVPLLPSLLPEFL